MLSTDLIQAKDFKNKLKANYKESVREVVKLNEFYYSSGTFKSSNPLHCFKTLSTVFELASEKRVAK